MMLVVPVTTLYASLNGLLIIYLAFKIIRIRRTEKIGVGDGGNHQLAVAIRAHANNIESAITVLPLLLIAELNGVSNIILQTAGILFLAGRLFHFSGFIKSQGRYSAGRTLGTLSVWVCTVLLACVNLYYLFT